MNQTATLQGIADSVIRRAERQGFVVPSEIRETVTQAGASGSMWKDVLALARHALHYRHGRYYFASGLSQRLLEEQLHQQDIHRAVRQLIRQHKAEVSQHDRRCQDRVDFIQPVKVVTDDGREFTLLSRDLSASGIRLIGTRGFLGQKVRVLIPRTGEQQPWTFVARILWTCAIGDDLFENGGTFLEVTSTPLA